MICRFLSTAVLVATSAAGIGTPLFAQVPDPQVTHALATYGIIDEEGYTFSNTPGVPEVYSFSPAEDFWCASRYDSATEQYVQVFVSERFGAGIKAVFAADVDPAPGEEILVVFTHGLVHVHDQGDKEQIGTLQLGRIALGGIETMDLDLDGDLEFVTLNSTGLTIHDHLGTPLVDFPTVSGSDLVIGQMDADPGLEIAATDGNVIDFATQTIQCTWALGFGQRIFATDYDQDGMEEIVHDGPGADTHGSFHVDTCTVGWSHFEFNVEVSAVGDYDMDGTEELLLGNTWTGTILAYDMATLTLEWSFAHNWGYDFDTLNVADVDMDGQTEILWTYPADSQGVENSRMEVLDPSTSTLEYLAPFNPHDFMGAELVDIDGDGLEELVTLASLGYGNFLMVLDPDTFTVRIQHELDQFGDPIGLAAFDMDGDGEMELLAAEGSSLQIYDHVAGDTLSLIWDNSHLFFGFDDISALDAVDLDSDGNPEIVYAIADPLVTDFHVVDYATGNILWTSRHFGPVEDEVVEFAFADLDNDGVLEILAMVEEGAAFAFLEDGTALGMIPGDFTAMRVRQVAGAPDPVYLGDRNGQVQAYHWDGLTFIRDLNLSVATEAIDGFNIEGLAQGVAFVGSGSHIKAHRPSDAAIMWESGEFGTGFGSFFVPLPNQAWLVGGSTGIYRIED